MLLRRGWFGRLREGFVPNVEMKGWALLRSVSVKLAELRRAVGLGEEWVFIGGLYDDVPNVEMFLDPWKVGGSLTFRHYAECRNEGLGEEWAFITAHYDVVPNVEMRSRSPADVLGGWVR